MAGEQNAELQTAPLHLASAFLAMEPTDILLSFARVRGGGGLITESVQRFIWDHCLKEAAGKCYPPYLRRFLKKLIKELESNFVDVMDEFYELLTDCLTALQSGSGVGICLAHVKASKVILSDGDLSTLANMELNTEDNDTNDAIKSPNTVRCINMPWESPTESGIQEDFLYYSVGADVTHHPHLVRILSTILHQRENRVASVIRNL